MLPTLSPDSSFLFLLYLIISFWPNSLDRYDHWNKECRTFLGTIYKERKKDIRILVVYLVHSFIWWTKLEGFWWLAMAWTREVRRKSWTKISQRKSHKQDKTMPIRRTTRPEKVVPNFRDCKEKGEELTDIWSSYWPLMKPLSAMTQIRAISFSQTLPYTPLCFH